MEQAARPGQAAQGGDGLRGGAGVLCIVPSMKVGRAADGRVLLTRKFLEGVEAYCKEWRGPVRVVAEPGSDDGLDGVAMRPEELGFELRLSGFGEQGMQEHLRGCAVVLGALHHNQLPLVERCAAMGAPLVVIAEQSVRTRWQITCAETSNWLLRLRRGWWNLGLERRFRKALAKVAGVQCNGTATYGDYSPIHPRALLYFDTRVTADLLVDGQVLAQRTGELLAGGPLRLVFSGRLVAIKGVDHLPAVADHLRRRGVAFTMDICGGGELEQALAAQIEQRGLKEQLRMRGVLDFGRELMPFVARQADLFVCCHRQGDPSCTYLETMSCGVPIAGYDNEAFRGLVEHCGVGWGSKMDDPAALADKIARLDQNRGVLAEAARSALKFAAENTFEVTMRRRVDHLAQCARAVAS